MRPSAYGPTPPLCLSESISFFVNVNLEVQPTQSGMGVVAGTGWGACMGRD